MIIHFSRKESPMIPQKRSKQRDAIINYLHSTKSHPTAEVVYNTIREDFPNISLGTVYRNLNQLSECGTIQKLDMGDGQVHFDGEIKPHNHFICKGCNKVLDLTMPPIDHVNVLASSEFDGEIEGNVIYFFGKCAECK